VHRIGRGIRSNASGCSSAKNAHPLHPGTGSPARAQWSLAERAPAAATRSHPRGHQNTPEVMYQYAPGASTPTAVYRIFSDPVGSPRYVVNAANGSDVLLKVHYSAFGIPLVEGGSLDAIHFGFAGGLYDNDTGLVHFGARDYDPMIGRWISKDPILFNGGQVNLYVYAGNDPVNYVDPSGEFLNVLVGAGIGAGIGALSAYATGGDVWAGAAAGAVTGGLAGLTGGMSLAGQILGGVGAGLTGVATNEAIRFLDGSSSVGPSALAVGAVAGASGPFAGILFRELGQPGLSGTGEFAIRRVACGISTAGVGIETKSLVENQ